MNLYTYIFEFRKGTYITQVKAVNIEKSMARWVESLKREIEEVYQLSTKSILEIEQELIDEKPSLLSSTQNVWSFSFIIKQGFGLVTVIQTEQVFLEKITIIELIKKQVPNSEDLIKQLQNMTVVKWLKKPDLQPDELNEIKSKTIFPKQIIVNRSFSLMDKDDIEIREVKLCIYEPVEQNEDEWLCSYQITEIQNNALFSILGIDALQSLQLALNIIEGLLKNFNLDNENQIIWIDKTFDLIK